AIGLPALCADAAGLRNLVRELATACAAGGPVQDEPPVQYADLSAWLNEMLEQEDAQEERARWRRLDPALHAAPLPFEPQAPAAPFTACTVPVPLPGGGGWEERLAACASERGTAVPVVLLAAWGALLARWTGGSEIVVGTLYEGRHYE